MSVRILVGDCRASIASLPPESIQTCVTSPPYWGLRDYGVSGQLGLEATPEEYVANMVSVFRLVREALRDDGTLWLNLGDSYAGTGGATPGKRSDGIGQAHPDDGLRRTGIPPGLKPKDLVGIPWAVAFALRADGWWLRSDVIWHKRNPMPESVTDRPTKAHEYVFLLSKSERYFYDAEAIAEPCQSGPSDVRKMTEKKPRIDAKHFHVDPGGLAAASHRTQIGRMRAVGDPSGRNARSVWTIATQPFSGAHFATMPPDLAERCIRAGSRETDIVLDPFGGAGTTGLVAQRLDRNAVLVELNPEYARMAEERIREDAPMFSKVRIEPASTEATP